MRGRQSLHDRSLCRHSTVRHGTYSHSAAGSLFTVSAQSRCMVTELPWGHYIGSISASPTACLLRAYGRAGTQNARLGEAVILSSSTPIPAQETCRRRCRDRADIEQSSVRSQCGRVTVTVSAQSRCMVTELPWGHYIGPISAIADGVSIARVWDVPVLKTTASARRSF